MRASEIREAGELTGLALREVSRGVHRVQDAIGRRVRRQLFAAVTAVLPGAAESPVAACTARVGDGPVTRLTYGAVGLGLVAGGWIGGRLVARSQGDDRPAGDSADALLAFVNGSHGHLLAARRSPLALSATVRVAGANVELTPGGVRRAWPDATGQLAVFVHGLVDTEQRWGHPRAGSDGPEAASIPSLLEAELGLTPVLVRYNTGRRVRESARDLGNLLTDLCRVWPVEVTRIVVVGHSMGGLVCRQAITDRAREPGRAWINGPRPWLPLVTDLVTLGSPHGGAWLEQAVSRCTPRLSLLPETEWFGEQLALRSDGIRDLGGAPPGSGAREDLPPGVREHAVVGAVMGGSGGTLGDRIGDFMVGVASARADLAPDAVVVLPGVHHLGLTHDPRVGRQLVDWLAADRSGTQGEPAQTGRSGPWQRARRHTPMLGPG